MALLSATSSDSERFPNHSFTDSLPNEVAVAKVIIEYFALNTSGRTFHREKSVFKKIATPVLLSEADGHGRLGRSK